MRPPTPQGRRSRNITVILETLAFSNTACPSESGINADRLSPFRALASPRLTSVISLVDSNFVTIGRYRPLIYAQRVLMRVMRRQEPKKVAFPSE